MPYSRPELLADPDWVASAAERPDVRIIDCGRPDGYARAHIPGAVHLRAHNFVKQPPEPGQAFGIHVMDAADFAELMGSLGVGADTTLVVYDDDMGRVSTRLWWVLRYYGHANAKVLDGGWHRWIAEGRRVTQAVPRVEPATFEARPDPDRIVLVDELKAVCERGDHQLFDTRAPSEYEGSDDRGNRRAGHLPGAQNLEWRRFVTDDDARRFRPAEELEGLVAEAGFTRDRPIVTYCQGGIRAAHAAFVLELLGFDGVRVYDGSMAEWANRDDTPLVLD